MTKNTKTSVLVALTRIQSEAQEFVKNAKIQQTRCAPEQLDQWKESEKYWEQEYNDFQNAYNDVLNNY